MIALYSGPGESIHGVVGLKGQLGFSVRSNRMGDNTALFGIQELYPQACDRDDINSSWDSRGQRLFKGQHESE